MKGRVINSDVKSWSYYVNWFHDRFFTSILEKLGPRFRSSDYKLRIALPISYFDGYQSKLFEVLKKAVDEGVLYQAKVLNKGDSKKLASIIEDQCGDILRNFIRVFNNPLILYLYEDVKVEQVVKLCNEIEKILIDIPALNVDHLSIADLPLTSHISFRKESLNGNYVAITTAYDRVLQRLRNEGESSDEYIALKTALENPTVSSTSSNALLTSSGMYEMGAAFVMGVAIGLALGLTPNTDLAVWAISLISLTPALATSVGTCLHWAKPDIGKSAANTLNEGCSSLWYNLNNFHLR